MTDVPLLGQDPPDGEQPMKLTTAFVVFVDELGRVGASAEPSLLGDNITLGRLAGPDDIYGACANVMRQLTTQFAALETHAVVQSAAVRAAKAAQDAKISQMVANSRNP